jgi:pantoate--beta-alanine ligase
VLFLQESGFTPDYFNVCRVSDLKKADAEDVELVLLAAARLSKTRLIDNVCFSRNPPLSKREAEDWGI